jgi:Pyridoxamine 5'-phosphate oxidase
MGKLYDGIDERLQAFIEAQHVFFVATAPLDATGHVNLSPKGLNTFRVLSPTTVAYLDYVGSGVETIAHLKENRRIAVMFCAFAGPPKIVRLHGRGAVLEPADAEYQRLRSLFPPVPDGRAIIVVSVDRISDSCGYGVPLYQFDQNRTQLEAWCDRKGTDGIRTYQLEKNALSIDGLPAVGWIRARE